MERVFIERMARTGDQTYAAEKAGYRNPVVTGSKLMAKPAVKAGVLRKADEYLHSEILPLCLEQHKMLLEAASTPAGARLGAIKLGYDETRGRQLDAGKVEKEPSEMTYDELQASIDALRQAQEQLAESAVDVTPDPGVFD